MEVDLKSGGPVFSKVGTQVGVTGDYEVHTSNGDALARGGDFVTLIAQGHTDVWVAQGTVELVPPDAKKGESITSDGTGEVRFLRSSNIADAKTELQADATSLTAALNFIPLANQKLKKLRDKAAQGTTLTRQ